MGRQTSEALGGDPAAPDSDHTLTIGPSPPLNHVASRPLPETIGRYRILGLLGEGGMGSVYQAEQQIPHRIVALKVIKAGVASAQLLRRFEQEAEALGRLQHPGIAQVYEAGTADSGFGPQPYFAMEFIQGQPLVAYAAERRLDVRARLELMAKVCDAVNHAHQRGIIHRDLKPGNILVDAAGQPKVLDFGVARVTDSDAQATRQTDLGQLIGTLAYMSPEQALADPLELDIRSDVYTLGVILYELLADKLPYKTDGNALHEIVRVIREEDPAPLSTIQRSYRGDIEIIVAKALEKDKARRYATAAELGADIRRHLTDQPIVARPPSASYQLRKFSRRHKAVVAGTTAVVVVLVGGVIASTWEAVRARAAEQRANKEAATAQAINNFLEYDLLAQADIHRQSGPNAKLDPDLKVRTALDRAAAKIAGKFVGQPEVEASIRDRIGKTYEGLGVYPEARKQLELALELRRKVLGDEHTETLRTKRFFAGLALDQGKYAEAEALFSQTLETTRRVLGPEHPIALACAVGLAGVYNLTGKYAQAEALLRQTIEIERRVLGPEDPDTLSSMHDLASTYYTQGKYAQAEPLFTQNLVIQRRVSGPEHPLTLQAMSSLANTYSAQGNYLQSESLHRQALEIKRRVLGPEHPETLYTLLCLANTYLYQAKYPQAEALYVPAVEIDRRVLGPEHPNTLLTMTGLAVVYESEGKYAQAEAFYSQIMEVTRRVHGPEHILTLLALTNLGEVCQEEGKYDSAVRYLIQALVGRRHVLGSKDLDTMRSAADLALTYLSQGKFAESEPLAREALETDRKAPSDNWDQYRAESLLGASLAGQKKYQEAEPLLLEGYRQLQARKDHIPAPDRPNLDQARKRIVQLYQAWGKPEKAAEWAKF